MRYWFPAASVCLLIAASPGRPQGPVGEWRVADGSAHIRIVACSGAMWGVVSWEKAPGRDRHNPDPTLRERPTLGMPVLLHMTPGHEPDRWRGHVYNARNGKTYTASIELRAPDTLHVEGCTLRIFCGGEDWTRLAERSDTADLGRAGWPATATAAAICARVDPDAGRTPVGQ